MNKTSELSKRIITFIFSLAIIVLYLSFMSDGSIPSLFISAMLGWNFGIIIGDLLFYAKSEDRE